jgi:ankyrin repeat protein
MTRIAVAGSRTAMMSLALLVLSTGRVAAAEIHSAAAAGDLARVQALAAADRAVVNIADDRSCRPLHWAADAGAVDVASYLLNQGADLEVRDVDGDTPLHWAAARGRCSMIELLLARGAKIDARNHQQATPLLYAAMRLQSDAVRLLVARGADVELGNDYGRTPLLYVTREGGDIPMARLLLELGANVDARDRSGDTPLSLAAWRGFRALVELYLDQGAEVPREGNQANALLASAVERGLSRLYFTLLAGGLAIDTGNGPSGSRLQAAAQGGARDIVADLIARGSEVDAVDPFGFTALHYAAVRGRAQVVQELLARGADPERRTMSGYSAWNLAEKERRTAVLAVLQQRGASAAPRQFPELRGPYLGQMPPGNEPCLFAPDIVARPWGEHSAISFSPDGREAYWTNHAVTPDSGYAYGTIWTSRVENGRWTAPCRAPFASERGDDVPFFAPGGERLYFLSVRPLGDGEPGGKENIWYVERRSQDRHPGRGNGWSEPRPLPEVVNGMHQHWQITVAANGNVYFNSRRGAAETAGLYRARLVDGEYLEPEFLGIDGASPFIAPDESYMLYTKLLEHDIHILFTRSLSHGGWSDPIDISAAVAPQVRGMCPIVSPDERYLFFIARGAKNNVAWVDAGFLRKLREEGS